MRQQDVFAVVLILGVSIGVVVGTSTKDQIMGFIQKTQQSPFGKALWGTLELEITAKAPGDYLVNLLTKMRQTLLDDITAANRTHEDFQGKCETDLTALHNEIRNHAHAVAESRELITKAQARLTYDQAQKDTEARQLTEAQDYYEKAKVVRANEVEVFDGKIKELNDALLVFHQGKSLIEGNLRGPSFAQVANHFNAYVQKMLMKASSPKYYGRGYISLISYIAELIQNAPVQANAEFVDRVLNILQEIIDELERAKNVEYEVEQERARNYQVLAAIWEKAITEHTNSIEKLTNEITQLQQTIGYNQRRIKENTRAIQVKGRQRVKRKRECQSENNQFAKENSKRQADFSLAEEALGIIMQNIDQFRDIVLSTSEAAIKGHYGSTAEEEGKAEEERNAE